MQEASFHRLADQTLNDLMQQIESAPWAGGLDVDLIQGILTITVEASGRQFVVSKHAPSRQLWLSSPLSGGLHFSYQEPLWTCQDKELQTLLQTELKALAA